MKPLLELFKESAEIKLEIDILISESNNLENPVELRLSILSDITLLHSKLNNILKEIRERRTQHIYGR